MFKVRYFADAQNNVMSSDANFGGFIDSTCCYKLRSTLKLFAPGFNWDTPTNQYMNDVKIVY